MKLTDFVSDYPVNEDDSHGHADKTAATPECASNPRKVQTKAIKNEQTTEPALKGPKHDKSPPNYEESRLMAV